MKIKRVYVPFWKWEDWQNGMWRKLRKDQEDLFLNIAIDFTSDWERYGSAMIEVVEKWKNTMLNNLTNVNSNRRAFLGHCACSYKLNLPEYIVRKAWGKLTEQQRIDADRVAQMVIDDWVEKNKHKTNRLYKKDIVANIDNLNFKEKIIFYIKLWENRCYYSGIPDKVPLDIFDKVPSYNRISLAILRNDRSLKYLGFTPPHSEYYSILKRIELNEREKQNE